MPDINFDINFFNPDDPDQTNSQPVDNIRPKGVRTVMCCGNCEYYRQWGVAHTGFCLVKNPSVGLQQFHLFEEYGIKTMYADICDFHRFNEQASIRRANTWLKPK